MNEESKQAVKEQFMAQGMTEQEAVGYVAGIERGLADRAAGRVRPWKDIRKELGLAALQPGEPK